MTLLVAVIVPSGIAMSTDSRKLSRVRALDELGKAELSATEDVEGAARQRPPAILTSDAGHKLFVVHDRYVIAAGGDWSNSDAEGVVRRFASSDASHEPATSRFLQNLIDAFRQDPQAGQGEGLLVGVVDETGELTLHGIKVRAGDVSRINHDPSIGGGALLLGYADVAHRLMDPAAIPWRHLSLQDAVDLSRFLVYATATQHRFELRDKRVGGPIDTAILDHTGARFVAHHEVTAHDVGAPPAPVDNAA